MTGMSVLPIGVGDAFSRLHYSSSVVLESGGQRLLIDCAHPIRKVLHEAGERAGTPLDIPDIDAVLITHLHGDHVSGLDSFAYFVHFALGKKVKLLCHPLVRERLWSDCLAAAMDGLLSAGGSAPEPKRFDDYFEWLPLSETEPVRFGPFAIESRLTRHHVPTTALRVTAGARTLGYSADTSYDPQLIDWLSRAHLILHETNLGEHTPHESLAALPESLRARMRLYHYPDGFDPQPRAIELLREGERLTV